MKKLFLLLMTMLAMATLLPAQQTVNLVFTATYDNGKYCPFETVSITNVTRGWTQYLTYPDTVLILHPDASIGEQEDAAFRLGEAYPNPFADKTHVTLEMPQAGEALFQIYDVDGALTVAQKVFLTAGTHRAEVTMERPRLAFLAVTTAQGRRVVKLVSTSNGGQDAINVEMISPEVKPASNPTRDEATGEFRRGDIMSYTALYTQDGNTISSHSITQVQNSTDVIRLMFNQPAPDVPEGILDGKFSVSADHVVQFSQGNLQYNKTTNIWSFMERQYDLVETSEQNVGTDYSAQNNVSLFGWGTSGYNCGNTCFQPWSTNDDGELYGPVGPYDLTNNYADCDWGYHNAIANGGNLPQLWRTMTHDEWVYLLETRNASTVNGTDNARYAKAKVADVRGIVLFPDNYTHPSGVSLPTDINGLGIMIIRN